MLLNGMIMLAGTIICFTASETLMGMFTENPETVRLGTAALQIISIGFIPSAISVTASGALEGLSKGAQSLVISLLRYIIVIIPAAYLLCHFAGADAVWNAFWICEFITAVVVGIGIKVLLEPSAAVDDSDKAAKSGCACFSRLSIRLCF